MPARSYEDFAPRGSARDYLGEHMMDTDERHEHRRHREMTAAERRRRTLDELEDEARNLAEYTRSKMEEMGERIRETAGSARDRARDTFGVSGGGGGDSGASRYLPDEQHRRYDESMRGMADKASEHARHGADRARDRMSDVGDRASGWTERTREGLEDVTSSARDRLSDVGGRVSDWGERTRESFGDVGSTARDRLGDVGSRAASWGERTRERVEELGSMARDRLQDFGGKVQELGGAARGKMGEYGDSARGQMGNVKHQMGDTMESARGRAQDTWRHNADAARELGGTTGHEYCLPLPTDRICARHALWAMLPLLLLFAMWYLRHRNPDKWNAGLKKLHLQREALGSKMQSAKDQTTLGSKMMSAKEQAMETLREEHEKLDKKKDK